MSGGGLLWSDDASLATESVKTLEETDGPVVRFKICNRYGIAVELCNTLQERLQELHRLRANVNSVARWYWETVQLIPQSVKAPVVVQQTTLPPVKSKAKVESSGPDPVTTPASKTLSSTEEVQETYKRMIADRQRSIADIHAESRKQCEVPDCQNETCAGLAVGNRPDSSRISCELVSSKPKVIQSACRALQRDIEIIKGCLNREVRDKTGIFVEPEFPPAKKEKSVPVQKSSPKKKKKGADKRKDGDGKP